MTKSPYIGICCGEIPSTRKVLSPTPRGLVSLAPNYPVALLTNHDSSVPVGSSRKRVGFVPKRNHKSPHNVVSSSFAGAKSAGMVHAGRPLVDYVATISSMRDPNGILVKKRCNCPST